MYKGLLNYIVAFNDNHFLVVFLKPLLIKLFVGGSKMVFIICGHKLLIWSQQFIFN